MQRCAQLHWLRYGKRNYGQNSNGHAFLGNQYHRADRLERNRYIARQGCEYWSSGYSARAGQKTKVGGKLGSGKIDNEPHGRNLADPDMSAFFEDMRKDKTQTKVKAKRISDKQVQYTAETKKDNPFHRGFFKNEGSHRQKTDEELRLGSETRVAKRRLGTNYGWHRHTLILRIISAQRPRHRAPTPSKF
eukprot:13816100-Heterocapsa_arctica.AAC.1